MQLSTKTFARLCATAALAAALPATAAPLPAAQAPVSITARDQPVGEFIRDLMGRTGRPVVVSGGLTGSVNGVFTGSVDKVFGDIAKAFNLVGYYDGATLYVYPTTELTSQTFNLGPAGVQRAIRVAGAQRLGDQRNVLRPAGGTLVAQGTPRFIEQVSALASGSGASTGPALAGGGEVAGPPPVTPLEFRVFYLRYARAEDTTVAAGGREVRVPGLATILQNLVLDERPGGSAGRGTAQASFGARPVRQSANRLGGLGLDAVPPGPGQYSSLDRLPILGTPTGSPLSPALGGTQGDPAFGGGYDSPAPLSTDIVRIEPNPYLNALIVRDVPERMAAYDSLVRALDVEPQLVEIEATIIDINVDKLRRLGVNWRFSSGGFGFLLGDGTDNDLRLLRTPGSRRSNQENITPSAAGGSLSTIIGSQRQFLGRINALEQKGAARVVSRPQIMTLSNVEAVFDRTRTFYVRVAGRAEVDLFNVTTGTVLRVNPHVFRDQDQNRIRMLVNIEDGTLDRAAAVDDIPLVERSSVSTQAMVVDGESLLLGGMTVDVEAEDVDRIPLLGEIPLLGNLFKTRSKQREHIERLFLITPRMASLTTRTMPAATMQTGAALPTMPPMPSGVPGTPYATGATPAGASAAQPGFTSPVVPPASKRP